MMFDVSAIMGVSLGFEIVEDDEEGVVYLAIDMIVVRLLFSWSNE